MTNIDALRANLSGAHGMVLEDEHYEKALIDVGLQRTGQYHKGNERVIDGATVKLYDIILAGASMSEGSVSYQVDKSEIRRLRTELLVKLGKSDGSRSIKSVSRW